MGTDDWAGFFFAGTGIVPAFLLHAGEPGRAMMAMVVLLFAGCIAALADPGAPLRS